jgi:metal-responsive CopG/Arc/MetJ family transcriptional regulator
MKRVQMTLEENLLREVDKTVKSLRTTRSGLIRASLRQYLKTLAERALEDQHRAGYVRRPVRKGEFDVWEPEQEWGD